MSDDAIPVAMIPWAASFREDDAVRVPARWLAVYAVLAAYANHNGYSWPSAQRIGILTRMDRDKAVKVAISEMVKANWLKIHEDKTGPGRARIKYRLTTQYDREPMKWFSLGRALIKGGVWAAMSSATRAVYVTLRAHAWTDGHFFCPEHPNRHDDDQFDTDCEALELRQGFAVTFGQSYFLPFDRYSASQFFECANRNTPMTARTYRSAMAWLAQNGLIYPQQGGDEQRGGYILPHDPMMQAPDVIQSMRDYEQAASQNNLRISAGTKRSLAAMKKRLATGLKLDARLSTSGNFTAYFRQAEISRHTSGNQTALQAEIRRQ